MRAEPTFRLKRPEEIEKMHTSGRILAACLSHLAESIRPGITTLERLVSRIREQVALRVWQRLSTVVEPEQRARLDHLLERSEKYERANLQVQALECAEALYRLAPRSVRAHDRLADFLFEQPLDFFDDGANHHARGFFGSFRNSAFQRHQRAHQLGIGLDVF